MKAALRPDELRRPCRAADHECFRADQQSFAEATVGQPRAVRSLELGIRIDSPGYNMFVTGLSGSGRTHTIRELLRRLPTPHRRGHDRVYVHNFEDPSRPKLLTFVRTQGVRFKQALREMVETATERIPQILDEDVYQQRRQAITEQAQSEEKALFQALEARIREDGFRLIVLQGGPIPIQAIVPVIDGKPIPIEALRADPEARSALRVQKVRELRVAQRPSPEDDATLEALVNEAIEDFERRQTEHRRALEDAGKAARRIARRATSALLELERSTVRRAVEGLVGDVKAEFDGEVVSKHLDALLEHMMAHPSLFVPSAGPEPRPSPSGSSTLEATPEPLAIYGANVIQEVTGADAPVIVERHPTLSNVFGTVERDVLASGAVTTDFTKIRPGALLRADGGFLIMYARDVLAEPGVWRNLMRTLRSRQLEIQRPDSVLYLLPSSVKPDPIDIDVKVILIGDEYLYQLLAYYEQDFLKVFKVKAEFDSTIEGDARGTSEFADVIRGFVSQDDLRTLASDGWEALAEQAARLAGHRERLSTRFGDIQDILKEADYWAWSTGATQIGREAVDTAIREMRGRHQLLSDLMTRQIQEEVVLIDTQGSRIGQINGLAVFGSGIHRFGKPTRITAAIGAGRGGLINIEREAHLSGPTHDKGILILAGYLRSKYGRETPLALTASIAFEQSYGGVDGDSASLAELYALLSAISRRPLRQSVAVTGSINQRGDVQAIGGVNEKIEGFFNLAQARGHSGQGCLIPVANQQHLMLDQSVVEAAEQGLFSVWTVDSVEDGIELMFGIPPSELHALVRKQLEALAEVSNGEPSVQRIDPARPYRDEPPSVPEDPKLPGPSRVDD